MAKKKQAPIEPEEPEHFDKESQVEDFMEIGGSPVPGITLRQVLRGHTGKINRIAWSPDGRDLASTSDDGTIRIWDIGLKECIAIVNEDISQAIYSVAWSPNKRSLAFGTVNSVIYLWDVENHSRLNVLKGHSEVVRSVAWSPNGQYLASASSDETIRIWKVDTGKCLRNFKEHTDQVIQVTWSKDGNYLASASLDNTIRLWNVENDKSLNLLKGHSDFVLGLAWSSDGKRLVSASGDQTVRIWDVIHGEVQMILEGHTNRVTNVTSSLDDRWLASKSYDGTVRLWLYESGKCVAVLNESSTQLWSPSLAFHPQLPVLATLGEKDTIVRIWELNETLLLGQSQDNIHYATAKLVLVGDSGVGKTGLGWRLAGNAFKEHSSTHGQQFWVIPELGLKRKDGTECEAVLWDLAGQPDYRLVHSLYLDDVDTALILFDPTNRQEPLSGVDFWLNQLKDKDRKLHNTILVGARTDRGTATLTETEIQAYCERNGISGGYVSTSALKGDGLPELLEKLKAQIPWDQMTTTVTTVTFKKIKEFVLALKEKTDRKNVLVQPDQLREQLQATDKDWQFSDAEMMTAVGHLETHGYVKIIHSSNGQHSILLAPDLLANLASSIVLEARRNPRGLGVLEEERLLHGEYSFPELVNLSEEESKILLDAAAVLFLEHNLCFRETFNNQTFLVFPSLINEKRPIDETIKVEEGASYRVKGAVENVYASLVVLLGYTNTFTRTHQWQNQAQYEMGEGEVCGFIQSEYRNGEIELVLYYGENTPDPVRLTFRGLFERFLTRRELEIARYQPVICHKCGSPLARNVVMDQLGKGKDHSFCHECGEKLQLSSPEPVSRLSRHEEVMMDVQQAVAQRRTAFEAALVRVKGLLRDQGQEKAPTCFISYAWGVPEHERWVVQFAKDLRNAGIDVLLDKWYVIPGANLDRYIERVMIADYVAVVGTPKLRQKYDSTSSDPVVTAELEMVNLRVRQPKQFGHTILPILLDGEANTAFAPQLQKLVYVDFRQSVYYFRQLFDMIWRLYDLPFDNPLLEELQASMTPRERP